MAAHAFINAFVVLPDSSSRVTTLRFDRQRILSLDAASQRGDILHDMAGTAVYPGLVNAHDHLELNHYPRTKFRPVYEDAAQWSADFTPRLLEEPFASLRALPLAEQCRIGGLKNLRCGVTTVAHHNPLHASLRRPDFPVRVLHRYGWAHSFALESESRIRSTFTRTPRRAAWFIHLAEGTDTAAALELDRLDRLGALAANTLLIHGVGLSAADRQRAIAAQAGLVWCPSSNQFLLGQTAQVGDFSWAGLLALGSDSRLTADGDLLDELRAADATGQLSPEALFRAVTTDAARLIRASGAGSLLPGSLPDFFLTPLTPAIEADPHRALLALCPEDIHSVWIGGQPRSTER